MASRVGVIGCGNISPIYLKNLGAFAGTEVWALADQDRTRAESRASEFNVPHVLEVDQLLAAPEVDIVLNLTIPNAHYEIAKRALEAGKHVYNEKPLAIAWDEGQELVRLATKKGLRIGCAPDTVLGAGIQTCRELIDDGVIGDPVAVQAFMMCRGHESWHPDPAFYYQKGGGPMFDMGPYYLTALINLLGPVRRVTGSARATFPRRLITSQPKHGQEIEVEVPTHLSTVLDFANGAIGQITTSFDVVAHSMSHIEVYGSEGSLRVPDPNGFGGPVFVRRMSGQDWEEVAVVRPYAENSRGLGVLDMALSAEALHNHRANGDVALHVLEIMHAAHWASEQGRHIELTTSPARPSPMPNHEL
ncbi:MAG: Gfo/Idh/MocA family oxidoreductase [Armatimonadetes bacterium]|nr:Gfo/Idh/MocA family oxidoreductase [Armatimonadota bacterium]